jgi:putative ABC transport system permease protein
MGTVAVPGQLTGSAVDLDMDVLPRLRQLDADSGDLDDLGPGQVVLDRATGLELGLAAGDRMVLARGSRTIQVEVAAVLPDRTPLNSSVMLDPADLNRLSVPAAHAGLLADATRPGEDGRAMALKGLRQLTDGLGGVNLIVLADQRDEMTGLIDAVIGLAAGLVGLTVLIAVVGVGTTTALTVAERRRESGLLRAVGMSRRGLLTMLTAEAGLYGMIGAVLGLVLGVPYGSVAVQAVGASAPLTLPVGQLAGVLLGLIALTAFAGVLPAWRASRVSPVTAISTDA